MTVNSVPTASIHNVAPNLSSLLTGASNSTSASIDNSFLSLLMNSTATVGQSLSADEGNVMARQAMTVPSGSPRNPPPQPAAPPPVTVAAPTPPAAPSAAAAPPVAAPSTPPSTDKNDGGPKASATGKPQSSADATPAKSAAAPTAGSPGAKSGAKAASKSKDNGDNATATNSAPTANAASTAIDAVNGGVAASLVAAQTTPPPPVTGAKTSSPASAAQSPAQSDPTTPAADTVPADGSAASGGITVPIGLQAPLVGTAPASPNAATSPGGLAAGPAAAPLPTGTTPISADGSALPTATPADQGAAAIAAALTATTPTTPAAPTAAANAPPPPRSGQQTNTTPVSADSSALMSASPAGQSATAIAAALTTTMAPALTIPAAPTVPGNASAPPSDQQAAAQAAQSLALSQLVGPGTRPVQISSGTNNARNGSNAITATPAANTASILSADDAQPSPATPASFASDTATGGTGAFAAPTTNGNGGNDVAASLNPSAIANSTQTAGAQPASDQSLPAPVPDGAQAQVALGLLGDPSLPQQVPVTAQGVGGVSTGAVLPPGLDQRTFALDTVTGGNAALTGDLASTAVPAMTQGVVQTEEPSAASSASASQTLPQAATANPAEQIKVQLSKGLKDGSDTINVLLHPEDLGTVEVKLQMQDGQVKATITADNPNTLALLKSDSQQLQQSLQSAGFNTDSNSLSFQLRGDQQGHQFAQQGQGGGQNGSGSNQSTPAGGTLVDESAPVLPASAGSNTTGLDISV